MTDPATPASPSGQDLAKQAAGRYAAAHYVADGARLGLGSGTSSHAFVRALAERVKAENLNVVGVPTSLATRELALSLGLTLVDLDDIDGLDVCIDGADEIDPDGRLIKGGGACLLWEKLVATSSARMIVVVDETKAVAQLGRFPLPIEVVQFSWGTTRKAVIDLLTQRGYSADVRVERRMAGSEPLVTDNGNFILDLHLGEIRDPGALTVELNEIPGVAENGLFVGIAAETVIGHPDGSAEAYHFPLPVPLPTPAGSAPR